MCVSWNCFIRRLSSSGSCSADACRAARPWVTIFAVFKATSMKSWSARFAQVFSRNPYRPLSVSMPSAKAASANGCHDSRHALLTGSPSLQHSLSLCHAFCETCCPGCKCHVTMPSSAAVPLSSLTVWHHTERLVSTTLGDQCHVSRAVALLFRKMNWRTTTVLRSFDHWCSLSNKGSTSSNWRSGSSGERSTCSRITSDQCEHSAPPCLLPWTPLLSRMKSWGGLLSCNERGSHAGAAWFQRPMQCFKPWSSVPWLRVAAPSTSCRCLLRTLMNAAGPQGWAHLRHAKWIDAITRPMSASGSQANRLL